MSMLRSTPNTFTVEESAGLMVLGGEGGRHAPVEEVHGLELGAAPGQVGLHPREVEHGRAVGGDGVAPPTRATSS